MKKLILSLFALVLSVSLFAQDAKQSLKDARKDYMSAISSTDNEQKVEKLKSALSAAEQGIKNIDQLETKDQVKLYLKAGEINTELANLDFTMIQLGQQDSMIYVEAPYDAYVNFKKAVELAGDDKKMKRDKGDALKGLSALYASLDYAGRESYGRQDYTEAYKNFNAVTDIRNFANDMVSSDNKILVEEDKFNDHLFLSGLSAYMAQDMESAMAIFGTLMEAGYKDAAVYNTYFAMKKDSDLEDALAALAKGRELFPDDESLRIAEINYYLEANKLDELTGKLKAAIDKTPDNVTLYLTLGHVYDNLYQRETKEGNVEKAEGYFSNALDYYKQGMEKDANNQSAAYSMGALYYNKAALMTKDLIEMEGDYSKAGLEKYNKKKKEVDEVFQSALPYFKKAEKLDPGDVNTLIALKEMYARMNDLTTSKVFKERLDTVQSGGKVDASYFSAQNE